MRGLERGWDIEERLGERLVEKLSERWRLSGMLGESLGKRSCGRSGKSFGRRLLEGEMMGFNERLSDVLDKRSYERFGDMLG